MFGIGSFIGRLKTGASLTKTSFGVLARHPRLLLFPLISAIASIAFLLSVLGPLVLFDSAVGGSVGDAADIIALFVTYVGLTFIATYSNAALVHAAGRVFAGEDPSVIGSLRAVTGKIGIILAWSVIAAIVGILIRVIEERVPLGGRIIAWLFSAAWTVATFFVVPVIVFEDPSVRGMFSESARTFRDTWGETLTGFGIGAIFGLIVFVAVAVVVTVPVAILPNTGGVVIALVAGSVVAVLGFLAYGAVWGVLKTALYGYAKTGELPSEFESVDFDRIGE